MSSSSMSLPSSLEIEQFARITLDVLEWMGDQYWQPFDTIRNGERALRWQDVCYTVNRGSETYFDPYTCVHENVVCEFVGIKCKVGSSFTAHMSSGEFIIACLTQMGEDGCDVEVDGQALQMVTVTVPLEKMDECVKRITNRLEKLSKLKFDKSE